MPTSDPRPGRRDLAILVVLLTLALVVRLRSLGWGLPSLFEEATPYRKALEFWGTESGRIDLNPRFYNYPSLTFYLHFAVQGVAGVVGALLGAWGSMEEFRQALVSQPGLFVRLGRGVTAVIGAATVLPVFWLGRRLAGFAAGLAAAALVAVSPTHAAESRSIGVDVPMAFAMTMALCEAARWLDAPSPAGARRTGLWWGLAAACKYPALLLGVPVALVALAPRVVGGGGGRRWSGARDAFLTALAAFAITSPFVLIDLPDALKAVSFERFHMTTGHFGAGGSLAAGRYLVDILPRALGWPALALALAGAVVALARSRPERLVAIFTLTAFLVLGSWRVAFDRYSLLLVPGLAVLAGCLLAALATRRELRGPAAAWLLALAALLLPARDAWRQGSERGRPSTRTAAAEWMRARIPRGSLVAAENYSVESLADSLPLLVIPFDSVQPHLYDAAYSLPFYSPFDYVVVSSAIFNRYLDRPAEFPAQAAFYDGLARRWEPVGLFESGGDLTGPTIRIFHRPAGHLPDLRDIDPAFFAGLSDPAPMATFLTSLAGVLTRAGRVEPAMAAAERAVALAPADSRALTNLAVLQARRGDYLPAMKTYERALAIAPDDPVIYYNRGRLQQSRALWQDAIMSYDQAVRLKPRFREAYRGLAACFLRMKEPDLARGALQRLLAVTPEGPEAEEVRGLLRDLGAGS